MTKYKTRSVADGKENSVPKQTVQVDVGGTVYKVSRSLVGSFPKTYLHKLVSKNWSINTSAPIFIDRNGDRFQYVLDFMRDKEIHLPLSIPKTAILRDLEFFGFDFAASDIHDGFASAQAATEIAKCETSYQNELELCHRAVCKYQQKITLLNVAHACFLSYTKTAALTDLYLGDYSLNLMTLKDDINAAFDTLNKDLFDECLAIHGLKYVSHRATDLRSNYTIWYYVSLTALPSNKGHAVSSK